MAKSTREILVDARALVARGLAKCAYASDADGNSVVAHSDKAVCWCVIGAVWAASRDDEYLRPQAFATFRRAARVVAIHEWNDDPERTQADVLDAFDRAIAACGGEA